MFTIKNAFGNMSESSEFRFERSLNLKKKSSNKSGSFPAKMFPIVVCLMYILIFTPLQKKMCLKVYKE